MLVCSKRRGGLKAPEGSTIIDVDRGTIFGNPFPVGRYTLDEALWGYVLWLGRRIPAPDGRQPPTATEINTLRGSWKRCWCATAEDGVRSNPWECHADFLNWLAEEWLPNR